MDHYTHGWQACRACHLSGADVRVEAQWHLRANPGYWGTSSPTTLVLGFSKGANQMAAARKSNFDKVAFAKMRERLAEVLVALEVPMQGQTIDEALTVNGRVLGAASLVRCGLSLEKDGKLTTSGTIMPAALRSPIARAYMSTCIQRHLTSLPSSVERVILLGTTDAYVKGIHSLMRERFSDYRFINEVAFEAQDRIWAFAAHPSTANGAFNSWLQGGSQTSSGRKRLLARQALGLDPVGGVLPPIVGSVRHRSTASASSNKAPKRARSPTGNSDKVAKGQMDGHARSFYLLTDDGPRQVPVRMKNRDTGFVAFRLSKLGNTKADSIEIEDEAEALKLCESGQYLIRVVTPGVAGSNALVRPLLNRRIVRV